MSSFRQNVQYSHTAWSSDSGLGAVFDIQQGRNGFLWLTTSKGVLRFDGVRFQSAEEVTNGAVRDANIDAVFISSSGGVWLTTRSTGLLLWKDGRLTTSTDRRCTPALKTEGIAEDQDGSLWIQASAGLSHMRGSVCEEVGTESGYPGGFPAALMVDGNGTLWVKTPAGPLLFLGKGQSKFQVSPYGTGPTSDRAFLHQAPDGSIWLSDDQGLRRVTGNSRLLSSDPSNPAGEKSAKLGNFAFDTSGSLWVTTNNGLERFDDVESRRAVSSTRPIAQSLTLKEGLSSDAVWKIHIDREGSIWVGTNSGLDRFRRDVLTKVSLPHAQENQFSIAAGDDGSMWLGNNSLPLTHMDALGRLTSFRKTSQTICLRRDWTGSVWSAGNGEAHLWHTTAAGLVATHYPRENLEAIAAVAMDRNRELWISTVRGNVYLLQKGVWIPQNQILGKRPGLLGAMTGDADGNVWFGFSHHVVKWDGSHYIKFSFTDPRLEISVTTMAVSGEQVWLGGTGGVELFRNGHFYLMRFQESDLPGRVSGIVETRGGDLWINGFSGVTHVSAKDLVNWLGTPTLDVSAEHFDTLDGLPGLSAYRVPEPSIVESNSGRLWFATTKGIAWLDPWTIAKNRNRRRPPVMILSAISNRKTYLSSGNLALPAHSDNLQIDYTALSLANPARVLFRYKLDPVDKDWHNAGTRGQAFYTNLKPGRYHFYVIACNNDGIWNIKGASLYFRIEPAWYQTIWSKVMLVLAAIAFLLIMYQFDRQRYVRLLRVRFDERLKERTRLARELHDTVLQTIQGSKMVADCAKTNLDDPVRTRSTLERLSVCLDRATIEARAAVNSLRKSATDTEDLASALRQVVESCVATDMQVTFSVNGIPRSMHPVGSREVFRIGTEAIRNACTHSSSQLLSIELEYGRDLTLRIRDSGRGFNPTLLNSGKSGHFGIMGMRERASNLGGRLLLKTAEEQGTCLTLIVPGRVIFRIADHSFFNIIGMRWIRKGPDVPKAPSILRHDSGME